MSVHQVEYSPKQIRELLYMIDVGNRSKVNQKGGSGLSRRVSTFGLVGKSLVEWVSCWQKTIEVQCMMGTTQD